MIFDFQSMFSNRQAVTADAASENVIFLGVPQTPQHAAGPVSADLGRGRPVELRAQVVENFNNLTSMTISIQVSDNEAFAAPETVMTTGAIPRAALVAGYVAAPLYVPLGVNKPYVRLFYDVTGTAPTTGAFTAGLVFGQQQWAV